MGGDLEVIVNSSKVGMVKTGGTVNRDVEVTIHSYEVGIGKSLDMLE